MDRIILKRFKLVFLFVKSWLMSFISKKEEIAYKAQKQSDSQRMEEVVHDEKKECTPKKFKKRLSRLYAIEVEE